MSVTNGKPGPTGPPPAARPPGRPPREPEPRRPDESPPGAEDRPTGRTGAPIGPTDRGPRGHFAPQTWDRQPGESETAYRAFGAYRDLGPGRTLVDAYRQGTGRNQAGDPSGHWAGWSKAHDWKGRALAYDHHCAAIERAAVDEVAVANARKWAARLDASAEADWQVAEALRKKVAIWAALPPIRRIPLADGKTLVEPVGIRDTERVAKIAQMASQMANAAIAQALPDSLIDFDFDPHTATTEQLTAAIERLDAVIGPAPARPRSPRIARPD